MNRTVVYKGLLFGLCAVAVQQSAVAQLSVPKVRFPDIAHKGKDAAAFAPSGWMVESQKAGDLNGDGRADIAFVLHDTEKRNVLTNTDMGVQEIDTNPRILCVAFANADGSGYTLALQNHTLIPRWVYPTQDDNFGDQGGEIKVARGALQVSLHYFANAGGWAMGTTTFTFRYQHGSFELIGFDNENHERNTGGDTSTSVDYSTGKQTIVTTQEEGRARTKRKTLQHRALLTIDTVGDGMEFEVPE
jgi:hypothetical protein